MTTRAYFIYVQTPITVTDLNDCDTLGKGDFELTWQLVDKIRRRLFRPRRERVAHRPGVRRLLLRRPLRHPDAVRAPPQRGGRVRCRGVRPLEVGPGRFPRAAASPPGHGPVAQLGNHHYEVRATYDEDEVGTPGDDHCYSTYEFTVYLQMVDDAASSTRSGRSEDAASSLFLLSR